MNALLHRRTDERRGGFALLTVLLVLLALLVLCAPFLMTARNASKASTQIADRAQARLALDSAARNARAHLGQSHPARDLTPYFDDASELAVERAFAPDFINPRDAKGVMWDAVVHDVAGAIDWNSAPPEVFANALGATTRLTAPAKVEDKELSVSTTFGFPPAGFVWVGREMVGYGALDAQKFKQLVRGIGAHKDQEGNASKSGPQPASDHPLSTIVIDQRAFAPALWRSKTPDGTLREFDAPEQVRECAELALGIDVQAGAVADELQLKARKEGRERDFQRDKVLADERQRALREFVEPIAARCSTFAGVRAGRTWQKPARVKNAIKGGIDDQLEVDELKWFAPGSTVQVTDGKTTELGIVVEVADGKARLMEPLLNDYNAFTAEARTLARRPVDVNLCSREVLEILLANLQVMGKNERITRDEAEGLASVILQSRPFTGFEDFLRRVVLPAAGLEKLPSESPVVPDALANGATLIDAYDAIALYTNALNANDVTLAYSTMPFAFSTRDVYDFDLRAVVNAPSGVERLSLVRESVEMIVPQRDLMQIWARQEDWDELLRLDREAPWWASGPSATSMYDAAAPSSPPSRWKPNMGTAGGRTFIPGITPMGEGETAPAVVDHTFASRDDAGWMQLWPSRVDELGHRRGHVEHFDAETRDPEGRYIPDQPLKELTTSKRVDWVDSNASATQRLLRAINCSMWIKPRALADSTYLDVGTSSLEMDRITLAIEGNDLVLRVLGPGGDISTTPLMEAGEARFALARGDGPGLAAETWSHVAIDVAGTRPSQITMLVDGRAMGVRTPGLTKLAGGLQQASTSIQVEDVEGFPAQGVVRIGNELIEYSRIDNHTLIADPVIVGKDAGFGGRLARMAVTVEGAPDQGVQVPGIAGGIPLTYPAGTPVEHYGFAATLSSNLPIGSSTLPAALGAWTVARAVGVVGGAQSGGDPIQDVNFFNRFGAGMEGQGSAVTGLILDAVDPGTKFMEAFSTNGGYAALVQKVPLRASVTNTNGTPGQSANNFKTAQGTVIFGVEVVKYSGWQNKTLFISQRGVLPGLNPAGQTRAFVVTWDPLWQADMAGNQIKDTLMWQTFVVPISVPAPGSNSSAGFLPPNNGSEFAQITHLTQAEFTEWVRYDTITGDGHLVRNEATAMRKLEEALTLGSDDEVTATNGPGSGGPIGPISGPASSAMSAPSSAPAANAPPAAAAAPAAPAAPASAQQTSTGYLWQAFLGVPDPSEGFVTKAARNAFQFRGVFGTFSHPHVVGTPVLPCWRVQARGPDAGEPGRLDDVILMEGDTSALGWPARIFRSWRPYDHTLSAWTFVPGQGLVPIDDPAGAGVEVEDATAIDHDGDGVQDIAVALEAPARALIPASGSSTSGNPIYDSRELARVLKHPSGELPRLCENVYVGGTLRNGGVPSAVVDEVVFGATQFHGTTSPTQGASMVLSQPFASGSGSLQVYADTLRIPWGGFGNIQNVASVLPTDAGLLRVGGEIVCYSSVDADTGAFTIPLNGRGLLGTTAGSHEVGEAVQFLDGWTVGVLGGQAGATASSLPLTDVADFPQYGTVLIDDELIHYTRIAGNSLDMPRRSKEPGEKDAKGDGLFRGRFGTTAAGHTALSPVILFPFRYWDRWAERADAPELAYVAPCIDQPNAFWRNVFWTTEQPGTGQSRIEVLQRLITRGAPVPPWDGDPDTTPGLSLLTDGMKQGEGNAIAAPADLIEWRAYVRYQPGAFDARTGLSHGWKETPRLKAFGVEYLGPNLVLRRVDQ